MCNIENILEFGLILDANAVRTESTLVGECVRLLIRIAAHLP